MAIDGRLLNVIRSINTLGICTVAELHRATGISRPAVHRMIDSLCSFGYTERVNGGACIRLTAEILTLSSGYKPDNLLGCKALPILEELQTSVRWPHSFATPEGDSMVIQQTTRDRNPFVFDNGRAGLKVPILSTAMGCAYLSAASPASVTQAVDQLYAAAPDDTEREALLAAAHRRIERARELGYALRSGGLTERTSTVAVPVIISATPVGALCTTFPTSAAKIENVASVFVPELQKAARKLAASFEN